MEPAPRAGRLGGSGRDSASMRAKTRKTLLLDRKQRGKNRGVVGRGNQAAIGAAWTFRRIYGHTKQRHDVSRAHL